MKAISTALMMAFVLFIVQPAQAQQKVGYVNVNKVLTLMPEYKAAEKELQDFAVQLEKTYSTMQKEYSKKMEDYQNLQQSGTGTKSMLELKGKEVADLESRMMEFQGSSQEELRDKEIELMKPIEKKLKRVINQVADDEGYDYVLDASPGGNLLVTNEADNLTPEVKSEMGL